MCLAHEGNPYGFLADSVGPLTEQFVAARCVLSVAKFKRALAELMSNQRVSATADGVLYVKRMVDDEALRLRRAEGGKLSIGHPNTHPPKEGYPLTDPPSADSPYPPVADHSRAGARAGSGSESESSIASGKQEELKKKETTADEWFQTEFWPMWPNRVSKQAAKTAAKKLTDLDRAAAIAALQSPAWIVRIMSQEQPIHASTWLNGRRWEDETIPAPDRQRTTPAQQRRDEANQILKHMGGLN
jgi:hypothetical protein